MRETILHRKADNMTNEESQLPVELIGRLARLRRVGVITGAGISQESGIQTYRGDGGLYNEDAGGSIMDSLRLSTLHQQPDVTWRTLSKMGQQIVEAKPNRGHLAIADIEKYCDSFVLLTQNVDALHQRAGSNNVIDLHGDIHCARCMDCGHSVRLEIQQIAELESSPRCDDFQSGSSSCGGVMRPGVILFEEFLPPKKLVQLQHEFFDNMPELLISVGTSSQFQYIVEPMLLAKQAGRLTIEVNPEATEISHLVDFHLKAKAGDVLPSLAKYLRAD